MVFDPFMHEVVEYPFWRTFIAVVSNPMAVGFHSTQAGATPDSQLMAKIKMTKQVEHVSLRG